MREAALEAVKVDENVAMWTNLCRTTVMPLDGTIEGNSKMLLKVLSTSPMLFDRKSLLLKIFDS